MSEVLMDKWLPFPDEDLVMLRDALDLLHPDDAAADAICTTLKTETEYVLAQRQRERKCRAGGHVGPLTARWAVHVTAGAKVGKAAGTVYVDEPQLGGRFDAFVECDSCGEEWEISESQIEPAPALSL